MVNVTDFLTKRLQQDVEWVEQVERVEAVEWVGRTLKGLAER